MAITAYQVAYSSSTGNGLVTPVVDRRLYEFLLLNTVGVADNVIGMWDRANKQFYTNGGTGTFTKGGDVT